jgi:hypothetical protein
MKWLKRIFGEQATPPASQPSRSQGVAQAAPVHTGHPAAPPPGMVLIPAGSFTMGDTFNDWSPEWGPNPEIPVHTNHVIAFYMDKYEVTKAQWVGRTMPTLLDAPSATAATQTTPSTVLDCDVLGVSRFFIFAFHTFRLAAR